MKTNNLFFSTLAAVLFALPSSRAFAQEASDSISIQVIAAIEYPGDAVQTIPQGINDRGDIVGVIIDSSGLTRGFVRFANGTFSPPIVEPNEAGYTDAGASIISGSFVVGISGAMDWLTATSGITATLGNSMSAPTARQSSMA